MKTLLIILLLSSCGFYPEVQVRRTCLTFEKMEVVERHEGMEYVYYWRDEHNDVYIEYSRHKVNYEKGYCLTALIKR